jgi:ParB family chromosome partitioning protein
VKLVDALAWIPTSLIVPSGINPRRDLDDIEDLARSIAAQGLIQPLVVSPVESAGTFKLLAGHRRLAALRALKREHALCLVRTGDTPADTIALMLVENGQRVPLKPLEEARAYRALMDEHGWTQAELGKRIGRSQALISQRLMLLNLPAEEQAEFEAGRITARDAREQARVHAGTAEQTRYTGWHFGKTHPLAPVAADLCAEAGHAPKRRIGGGACGACWEQAIRSDERGRAAGAA